jgi:hydroxypyruvate isomerase
MPRLAANLSMMFNESPFLDRFAAAAAAGFKAVEFLFPYEHPAAEIAKRLSGEGLTMALFNLPPGDWAAGERGLASLPGREEEFRAGVLKGLEYADALGCPLLHCMAGIPPAGQNPVASAARYAARIAWAAEQALAAGRRVVLEPINHRDMPGYFLNTTGQGAAIVEALGVDRLGLQFDIYHCQVTEGDLTKRLEALMPVVAHVQIADVPKRNEPGTGEIAWDFVLPALDRLGYAGWVGCEYRPAGDTVAGLGWRERYGVS